MGDVAREKGPVRTFRDLDAWKYGMELSVAAYRWSAEFPPSEKYGMASQLRRAASSVPLNIAEGFGEGTTKTFLRQLRDARGSLAEVDTAIELSARLFTLAAPTNVIELLSRTSRVLQGLITSLERKLKDGTEKRIRDE